jgi:hypothetical protein
VPLTAVLSNGSGAPLSGKTVSWSVTAGSITPSSATTDNSGRANATYTAPTADNRITVTVTASFSGDNRYFAAAATFAVTVLPQEQVQVLKNMKENLQGAMAGLDISQLENENICVLENAFVNGNLGAIVTITIEVDKPGVSKGYERENVRTRLGEVIVGEKIEVVVESEENGKTVVINIENDVLSMDRIQRVLVDNVEIGLADDYADVLDPTNEDVPEYLILKGGRGVQILVSIPHFSARTITIGTMPTQPLAVLPPMQLIIVAAIALVAATLVIVWRYISLGTRKLRKISPGAGPEQHRPQPAPARNHPQN